MNGVRKCAVRPYQANHAASILASWSGSERMYISTAARNSSMYTALSLSK